MTRALRRAPLWLAVSLLVSLAPPLASAGTTGAGCVEGSAGSAARTLVHEHATVAERDRVAGFQSALVLEPVMDPMVRHRLIRAGDRWCTAEALNEAWRLDGRPFDGRAQARAYAQLGGAAFFDGVRVLGASSVGPTLHVVQTHSMTNGVVARWVIAVDARGVRSATWTATDFAVEPFVPQPQGFTALPGEGRSYARTATGEVVLEGPLLPGPSTQPELVTEAETVDEFVIRVSSHGTEFSPNAGLDTGVTAVDYVRIMRDAGLVNYNAFHAWGFRKNWASNVGTIFVDNTTAASCLACVQRSTTFNIHMHSQVLAALAALGFEYPDDRKALYNIIGHEMVHNWQNAYGAPDFNQRGVAFSEGTARMSEATHGYSDVSHQPLSLIYHTGREIPFVSLAANSCNGWSGANIHQTFANGPFTSKTYNACYFWLTWYKNHGPEGMVALFDAMRVAQLEPVGWRENSTGIEMATGQPILTDLVAFAAASLTGHGYTWAAGDGTGPERDWSIHLERWEVPALAPGGSVGPATLRDGGILARELQAGGYLTLSSTQPEAAMGVVRATAEGAEHEVIASGDCVEPPAEGERVWAVGVYPAAGASAIGVSHTPLEPGLTECPKDDEEEEEQG